jgi:hypothetical protein
MDTGAAHDVARYPWLETRTAGVRAMNDRVAVTVRLLVERASAAAAATNKEAPRPEEIRPTQERPPGSTAGARYM